LPASPGHASPYLAIKMGPIEILYEDNHLIAVNKPGGLLVQGDKTEDEPLSEIIKDYLRKKYKKPGNVFCGVIHRLDRPVTGLVLLARTSKALERMSEQFRKRQIKKTYVALVTEKPPENEQTLVHWLKKDTERNVTRAYEQEVRDSKLSQLSYRLLGRVGKNHLLEIQPESGRPHQIRAQLAFMGCPIVGDVKYGFGGKNRTGFIYLHAYQLQFTHPVKKEPFRLTAAVPDVPFWNNFRELTNQI